MRKERGDQKRKICGPGAKAATPWMMMKERERERDLWEVDVLHAERPSALLNLPTLALR